MLSTLNAPFDNAMLRVWVWLSWHRKTRFALAVLFTCVLCQMVNVTAASAADDTGQQTAVNTYMLPLKSVTDTHGVPLGQYTELPLDYGQGPFIARQIRGILMRLGWMLYTLVVYSVLALCNFVLTLEWIDWILAPFTLLANSVDALLDQTGIIGLGAAISCVVIAWGFIRGKMATALAEIVLVAIFVGLTVSPVSNPSEHIKSWISTSADYGSEAGTSAVAGTEAGAKASTDPISGKIIDLAVRNPALMLSFGSNLEGDKCAQTWDSKAKAGEDAEKLRKAVLACNKDFKVHNETDNFLIFAFLAMFWVSTGGLMALIVFFLIFLLKDAVLAGIGLINTVFRVHLAVFPGGGRQAFINAFLQLVVNVIMVGAYIFLLSLYLWLVGKIHDALGGAAMMIGNLIFGFVLLALALTFWHFKRQGKSVARRISEALGSSPLNQAAPVQPSGFSRQASQLAASGKKAATSHMKTQIAGAVAAQGVKTAAVAGAASAGAATAAGVATGGASVAASQVAAAGWFMAGNLYNAQQRSGSRASAGTAPHTHASRAAESRGLDAGPSYNGDVENLRDDRGSIPMPATAPRAAQSPASSHYVPSGDAARTSSAGVAEGSTSVTASQGPVTGVVLAGSSAAAAPGAGSHATSSPPQPRSTLPTGQYGTVRVNRNGSTNTVHVGGSARTVPDRTKVTRAWEVGDPGPNPVITGVPPRNPVIHDAQNRARVNHAAERGDLR